MKPIISLLLPVFIGAVQASTETAKVYVFQEPQHRTTSITPTLSLEEAKLVITQRLRSHQHDILNDASKDTLEYISTFGGEPLPLFADEIQDDGRSHLVIMIGVKNEETFAKEFQQRWRKSQPDFEIANPTSKAMDRQFMADFSPLDSTKMASGRKRMSMVDEMNPLVRECWSGRSKIMYLEGQTNEQDINDFLNASKSVLESVANEALDIMVIVLPESSWDSTKKYGTHGMPSQPLKARQAEEPIELEEVPAPFFQVSNTSNPSNYTRTPPGTFSSCYSSQDSCEARTRNCSGHGNCYAKINANSSSDSCYTCQCIPSLEIIHTAKGEKEIVTYWGGPACQKMDISDQFWLFVSVAVVLTAVVSATVGMMLSVGEEKLPGVIGAGVAGPKAR